MSRRKRGDPQGDYLTKDKNGRFARVFKDLYESPAYLKLTPSARDIYIGLVMETGGKNWCYYPYSAYITRCTKDTFHKSIGLLEEVGFIEVTRYRTTANKYKLSEKWKQYKP